MVKQLRNQSLTTLHDLLDYCSLHLTEAPYPLAETTVLPVLVPAIFADNIMKNDWYDPLLLQVIPRVEETLPSPGNFSNDPVGDTGVMVLPGLLHKYAGRVLMMTSASCGMHCRYCFRREHCCPSLPVDGSDDEKIFAYLKNDTGIEEVILSGGDPLTLRTTRLEKLIDNTSALPSVTTLRFHTRIPVIYPPRVDIDLLQLLEKTAGRFTGVMVLHVNHPNEINDYSAEVINRIRSIGFQMLNQTVLLKGINDSATTLMALSKRLIAHGVLPYYLHQLDRVTGTHHFEVAESTGVSIISELRRSLPGYAVPRYVQDIPGNRCKLPIC